MNLLVLVVSALMAAVLLWAALEKARALSGFVAVLRALSIPGRGAAVAAVLVTTLELGVALGLIFRPGAGITIAALVGLAAAFASASVVALWRNLEIHCGCLGPYGGRRLGTTQLAVFPLWLGGAVLLWLSGPAPRPDVRSTSVFALVALTVAAVRGVGALRAARYARGDRRSAQEMFVWLSR